MWRVDRLGAHAARPGRPVSCVYFAAPSAPRDEALVMLDADRTGPASNVAVMSNVAPGYSPDGRALVAAACIGSFDDALAGRSQGNWRRAKPAPWIAEHWRE